MSFNAGQPPTPSSESTAIEVRRIEGTMKSYVAGPQTLTAGTLVKLTNSGLIYTVGTENPNLVIGVVQYTVTSGQRAVVGKGQMRVTWDGVGTPKPGDEIQASATQSGWFTAVVSGPSYTIGRYDPLPGGLTLAAANSGLLQVVSIP